MALIYFEDGQYIRADLVTCVQIDTCSVYVDTSDNHRYSYHGYSKKDAEEKCASFVSRLNKLLK